MQPNGLLARFTDVVDNFTEYDMTPNEALQGCVERYGYTKDQAMNKILSAFKDHDRFQSCLDIIEIIHGPESCKAARGLLSKVSE